ncbi:hypothetical protein F0726_01920 [Acidithiobacillus caldus]|nr:hypothetical protein F0726_01920 [Acidithiobacillus caldus]
MLVARVTERFSLRDVRRARGIDDLQHGTDYVCVTRSGRPCRLAARVRRAAFLRFRDEFTIREDRPRTGHRTELEKIRAGDWADFYAYGFSDGKQVLYWSFFRMAHFDPDAPFSYMPGYGPKDGQDAVTRVYRIEDQPPGFVVSQGDERERVGKAA